MTYRDLKKRIKAEQNEQNFEMYIAYMTDRKSHKESLISNFIDNCSTIKDEQLDKAVTEGLLTRDWDTFIVIKKEK